MKNYTPHAIVVRTASADITFPPCGIVPRVEMASSQDGEVAGCPVVRVTYGRADLPAGETGPCLVSSMFADAYRRQHGDDGVALFTPDSGPTAIRENGQVVAVRALIRR